MHVPDGNDGIEFMLYKDLPAPDQRGSAHHLCLEVPSISSALETLQARPYAKTYAVRWSPERESTAGVN